MSRTLEQHLFDPGPKRILALDGGGIRGILTLQILRRIETLLRARSGRGEDFRLCDYFDLIGGTSTGAIIAAGLAVGLSVDELEDMYKALGNDIFQDDYLRWGIFRPKFSAKPLRTALEATFGDIRLGDPAIRTSLAVMLKRLDTGSPWVLHNNPKGRYFQKRPGGKGVANRDYLLRDVVRASTAAPHYFEPEMITVAEDAAGHQVQGAFVDGGVSPHNNPALQLLLLATLKGYGLHWSTGADQLLLVSLGTGRWEMAEDPAALGKAMDIKLAMQSLASLMDDALALNELLLQWLSGSATARPIDREVGDLAGDVLGGGAPWLSYHRYNAVLSADWLQQHVGLALTPKELDKLQQMDEPKNMGLLVKIGKAAAKQVDKAHFPAAFDVARP
ncbi:MAG: hypothetical protein RLZ44_1107 [Pseudomonadota bacterium]